MGQVVRPHGEVNNPGRTTVVDTDVYARILDAGNRCCRTEPALARLVMQLNASFYPRMSIPAGTLAHLW